MQTIDEYLEDKEMQEIVNQIVELKMQHPLSEEDKLKLQKLQQKLNRKD